MNHRLSYFLPLLALSSCMLMPFKQAPFSSMTSGVGALEKAGNPAVGQVLHYIKSNLDGSGSTTVDVYVESNMRTQSFKVYPEPKRRGTLDLVVADYDYDSFMASSLEAFLIHADGRRTLNAVMTTETPGSQITKYRGMEQTVLLGHIPGYNYNFDFTDLNFMLHCLKDKRSVFEFGVIAPDSRFVFVYCGKARLSFERVVSDGGQNLVEYSLSGEAFGATGGGKLVYDEARGCIVSIECAYPNNPGFSSFKFSLQSAEAMTIDQWNAYIVIKTTGILGK